MSASADKDYACGPVACRGFTLIEVLLAMAITALIAVMAYAGLSDKCGVAPR